MSGVDCDAVNILSVPQTHASQQQVVSIQRNTLFFLSDLHHSLKLVDCVVRAFALNDS